MQIRRFIVIGLGAAIAACGSMAGAVGLLSPPQSAPVGLSVYHYSGGYASSVNSTSHGVGYVSLGLNSSRELNVAAGVAIPPAGATHSSSKRYSGYVSACTQNNYWHCTTLATAFGSFSRRDLSRKLAAGTIRFKKQSDCGLIDVTFKPAKSQLFTDQAITPSDNAIPAQFRFTASRGTNSSAQGVVCGHRLDTKYAWLSSNITAELFRR